MKAFHAVRAAALSRAVCFAILLQTCSHSRGAAPPQTNLAVVVRHAPVINAGRLEGSLQQLLGEGGVLNSGAVVTGDWLVPGLPKIKTNGAITFSGVVAGSGATTPAGYTLTLNSGVSLRHVRTRIDPVPLPAVPPPPAPTGTRHVTVNAPGQNIGSFATLRNLTLNGNVGLISVPPGTYGSFTANAGSGFVLGIAGAASPAVYNLQSLVLNGATQIRIVGPVVLTLANGVTLNGAVGDTNHPSWFQLRLASGGVTLNSGSSLGAMVTAPNGTVTINASSVLLGAAVCDRFILNAGGVVRWGGPGNQAPTAQSQTLATLEDVSLPITLSGSDPEGDSLTYLVEDSPAHGQLTGTAPNLFYAPAPDFNGTDSISFRVNDGQTYSAAANVNFMVSPVNDAPSFARGADQEVIEDAGPLTITGWATAVVAGPADESNQAVSFLVTNDHPGLFASPPSVSSEGTLTYTPAADAFGVANVMIRLQDGGGIANSGIDTSAAQTFVLSVLPVNDPPVIAIQTPTADSSFDEGATIPITVEASDPDGSISRVAFEVNGSAIGERVSAPFQFPWNGAGPGVHLLTATAYDNDGAATASAPVRVSVTAGANDGPPGIRSNQGTDFWLTFLENNGLFSEPGHYGLNLVVTAVTNTTGTITIPGEFSSMTRRFSVGAGGSTLVSITDYGGGFGHGGSDVTRANAIHVSTDEQVSVHALSYLDYTTDGYTALPTALLGTEYVVLGYPNSGELPTSGGEGMGTEVVGGTQFAVVATENNTVVSITPSFDSGSRLRGVPYEVVLQQGESYRLIDEVTPHGDFTGTRVVATKPVAVLAGSKCALVPETVGACDHLIEQLPPVSTWGRRFLTVPFATRRDGDTFRIVASRDSTLIAINGEPIGRLNRGESLERILTGPSEIVASEPVLVAQFAHGTDYDGVTGDPSMALVQPVEQFSVDYAFATPREYDYWAGVYVDLFDNHLNLTIRTEDAGTVRLDGGPLAPGLFIPIGGSGYSGAQVSVPPGAHRVVAEAPFGASIYGWAEFESYAFVGGISSAQLETGTQLALWQVTPFAAIGGEKVVIARVTNGGGATLADLNVTFEVSGANPARATVRTSRLGEAAFSYRGSQPGVDVIRASLESLVHTVTNEWLTTAGNQPPLVSAGTERLVNFGETVQLNGTLTDDGLPAGGSLTASWRTAIGPVEARFATPAQAATAAWFDLPGTYLLELTADDSQFSARSLVTISVNALPEVELNVSGASGVPGVGETLTLSVAASDLDGTIARIEFYDGDTEIGELTGPTAGNDYLLDWIVPDGGVHELTAVAVDDSGGTTRSTPVRVRGNLPPTVQFLTPAEGQGFDQQTLIDLTVEAIDPDGTVTAVYYFANGEYIGVGWGSDFHLEWTPATPGAVILLAVAEDNDGWFGVSEERRIEVRPVTPTVVLSTTLPDPARGALVGFPLVLTADARVTAPFRIDRVDFRVGDQPAGQATNWPFQILYTPTNSDPLLFVARAYAESGGWADSAPVPVQPGPYLAARWENLSNDQWMPLGKTQRLVLQTEDPGRIFAQATFLVDGVVLAETPFTHADWTPDSPGDHQLDAWVTDILGNVHSAPVITVRAAELIPPRVRIVSPANLGRFAAGSPVPVEVEALDADGVVTLLTLTRFSTPEASATGGSLSQVWTNLAPGEHTFTAVAVDDTGQAAEATVRVLIELPVSAALSPPVNLRAEARGCNAARISWAQAPGSPPGAVVVIERTSEREDVWTPVALLPGDRVEFKDSFLQPSTAYRYRAYVKNAIGERSVDSGVAEARTRIHLPRFAALDPAEGLVDEGIVQFAETGEADDWWRRVSLDVQRIDNSFLPVTPEYLNGLIPLGLSDNNRVLMINGASAADRRTFLWRPDGRHQQFDRATFDPYRLALPGVPVGLRGTTVLDSEGQPVSQSHAGLWVGEFLDFTPDVTALTVPAGHAPTPEPLPADNCLIDVNVSGVAVGRATWAYFESQESGRLLLPPAAKATVWPGLGQPAINFGALGILNNTAEFLAINDSGDLVGLSRVYDPLRPETPVTHAVRSHLSLAPVLGEKLTDLGTLGGLFSAALSINRAGWAVGYSTVNENDWITQTRAAYWDPAATFPRPLPGFGNDLKTYGWAINDHPWAVGDAVLPDGQQHAALWTWSPSTNRAPGFELSDLNDLLTSSDWLLTSAQYVNRDGFISGVGTHAATVVIDGAPAFQAPVPRVFLLVPNVSLAVDYNRDGRIQLDEHDDLPPDVPYQFWVNDDTDSGDEAAGDSDIPGAREGVLEFDGRRPNYADEVVNGTCDLPDWFPVYLNITNLLSLFPPESHGYVLRHADGALNFAYTDLLPENAGSYLTNRLASGFGAAFDRPPGLADSVRVAAEGTVLSPFYLEKIRSEGRGILLFEARQPTDQPLQLEVWNNRRVVARVELPLAISGVEDLYGWVNLRGALGQTMERLSSYLNPANLPEFSKEDRHVLFVHGYNVNEKQSRGWSAEMFKRLWWSGSNARFYGVSWHGDESQFLGVSFNYQANVIHSFATAPLLASFVNGLAERGDVTLIAHSMGNLVAGAAIQDHGARPARYFMMDAAVAIEAYAADAEPEPEMTNPRWRDYEPRLFASEWHQLFPPADGRRSLTWRGRFSDVVKRTTLFNFYSSGEEVLANMNLQVSTVLAGLVRGGVDLFFGVTGSHAWAMQETLKGTGLTGYFLSSTYGGWGFNGSLGELVSADPAIPPVLLMPRPSESTAARYPDATLRTTPFFDPGPAGLYLPTGGIYARDNQTKLLAEMFPVRTFAAGRNRIVRSGEASSETPPPPSIDMNTSFKTGWPPSRLSSRKIGSWLHSDLRDVAFPFNHGLYHRWVQVGDLK